MSEKLEKILEEIDAKIAESMGKKREGLLEADRIIRKHMDDGWIPVEEQLPEPGRIVIVHQCYSWEKFEDYACVTIGRISPDTLHWEFQYYRPNFERGTIMDNDIICPGNEYVLAWRPLPEPYQPETVPQRPEWKDRMLHTFLGGHHD